MNFFQIVSDGSYNHGFHVHGQGFKVVDLLPKGHY